MKKTNWLLISTLGTLAGVSVAAAHHGGPGGPGGLFARLDANQDGVITIQEVEADANKLFAELDTNQDGKVTAEERKAAHTRMQAKFEDKKAEHFEKLDKNDNGVLERNEIERMPDEVFERLDADKSGTLSFEELADFGPGRGPKHGHKGKGPQGDPAGDAVLTQAEFVAKGKQLFQKFDTNRDGKVTQEEAKAARGPHGPRGGFHKGPNAQ